MTVFAGEVYASAADGTLYAYALEGASAEWSKRDDGSVWVWNRFWAGRGQFYGTVIWGAIGLILGLVVGCVVAAIVIARVAPKSSRATQQPPEGVGGYRRMVAEAANGRQGAC